MAVGNAPANDRAFYVLFYLMTVFSLSFGTAKTGLGYERSQLLVMLMAGVMFFGLTVPLAGRLADRFRAARADRHDHRDHLVRPCCWARGFGAGSDVATVSFLVVGLGPMGAVLKELFPTAMRYTGSSVSYNVASLLGASVAAYIATWLASSYGLG